MALAVCLLFDADTDRAIRQVWQRLETAGVPTLLSHTHGRHVPHLSYAVLRSFDVDAVTRAVDALPDGEPVTLHFDALGMFRRSRCWLVPAVSTDLVSRQERVVEATLGTGADLHRHYCPGRWVPHCTLAPRLRLEQVSTVAAAVYDVLPLTATVARAALINSGTGARYPLATIP
jgi:2'-5' RNA ligase